MASPKSEGAPEFGARLGSIVDSGFLSLALGIGHRLKLFDAIADLGATDAASAKTAADVAAKSGLRERYIQEWLGAMACGEIVEVDESGTRFWIPEHRVATLRSSTKSALSFAAFTASFGTAAEAVGGCFSPDGPTGLGYDHYAGFHEFMSGVSTQGNLDHLIQDHLPSVPGLVDNLKSGIRFLDLGCGVGVPSLIVAKEFPKTESWGIDFTPEAIKKANVNVLPNLHYEVMDAAALREDWAGHFDYVTAFDSIHDQAYPDKALAEVFRVLKPGGCFSMVDINGTSNPNTDLQKSLKHGGGGLPFPSMMYSISLLHCMPVSLAYPNGQGLGAMWGARRAKEHLIAAGFADIQVLPMPWSPVNVHFLATKPL